MGGPHRPGPRNIAAITELMREAGEAVEGSRIRRVRGPAPLVGARSWSVAVPGAYQAVRLTLKVRPRYAGYGEGAW